MQLRNSLLLSGHSLRSADAFPVVASLPPKNREATTGNASALRRLIRPGLAGKVNHIWVVEIHCTKTLFSTDSFLTHVILKPVNEQFHRVWNAAVQS